MKDDDDNVVSFPSKEVAVEDILPEEHAYACNECDCTFWVIYESNIECAWCHVEYGAGDGDE